MRAVRVTRLIGPEVMDSMCNGKTFVAKYQRVGQEKDPAVPIALERKRGM
jgi:hypothetical protein